MGPFDVKLSQKKNFNEIKTYVGDCVKKNYSNDPEKNTISAPALKEDSDEDDDDEFVKILDSSGSLKPEEDDYEEL